MSDAECAVVLTAGYGSRLFPVTSVVQKSLMPVLNLPVLHYVLADLVAAGVQDIAIVVDRGDHAIEQYVQGSPAVAETLKARGWSSKYEPIASAHAELAAADFTFIEQDLARGEYGTAVPAMLAAGFVADRSCFYLSGDDLLMAPGGGRNVTDVTALRAAANGLAAAMQVAEVPAERAHRYGVVDLRAGETGWELASLAEKVAHPSGDHANISRYYFSPEAFRTVTSLTTNTRTGELMITDALVELQRTRPVGVSVASGSYFDYGSVDGWHEANVAMAAQLM